MPTSPLFRSTSVKLSIAFAGLVVTSFLLVGIVIWLVARHSAETELRQDIQLELVAIRTELASEGLDATIAAINARAEHPGALEYWFADPNGKRLAGDIPQMDGPDGWRDVLVDEKGQTGIERREEMLVFTETLPGGTRLSVGDDLEQRHPLVRAGRRRLPAGGMRYARDGSERVRLRSGLPRYGRLLRQCL